MTNYGLQQSESVKNTKVVQIRKDNMLVQNTDVSATVRLWVGGTRPVQYYHATICVQQFC